MKPEAPQHNAPETGVHPPLEVLLQLALGELSEDEAFAIREHLLGCAACLERARSLAGLPEPPAAAAATADDQAAAWRGVKTALELPDLEAAPALPPAPAPAAPPVPFPAPRRSAGWLAVAAALLLGVALGLFAGRRGPAPVSLAASTQLLPTDFAVLGTPPEPDKARCPPADGFYVWILGSLEGGPPDARYSVELTGPAGARRIEATRNRFGELEIVLPRQAAPAGPYRLLVENLAVPGAPAKEFRLTVDCP